MIDKVQNYILRFTDKVQQQTRDEMEIIPSSILDGNPVPEASTENESWRESLYGQQTRDVAGKLIATCTGGIIPDLLDEINQVKKSVTDMEALLKRIQTIAGKRGKHTEEEKKRHAPIERYDKRNAETLLSDRTIQG